MILKRHIKCIILAATMVWCCNMEAETALDSLNSVDPAKLKNGMVTSSLEALNGQAAGVQVQTQGNHEAMVSAVRVRGTTSLTGGNDPLVIIDGVISDLTTLSTVYPADIESISILKDASETSQYGSRGASGVINVVTKKGRGGKFHISYDGIIGFEAVHKQLDMLDGNEFRKAANSMGVSITDKGGNTNYTDAITRTGLVHNHHIYFGGGTESSNYRVSLGLRDHNTIIRTNRIRQYTAKLDVTQRAFDDRVTFDLGVFGNIQDFDLIPFRWKLLYSAATFNPTIPDGKNSHGGYDQIVEAPWISNPNSILDMDEDEDGGHINAHLRAKADIGYGIMLTAMGSYSYTTSNNAHFYGNEAYRGDTRKEELLGNIMLEKGLKFATSSLDLMGLAEIQYQKSQGFNVTSTGFSTSAFSYNNLSAGTDRPWEGTGSFSKDSRLQSFLLRAKYTLMDRYTLTVNARIDGTSKVAKNHRWGFFPSVSGTWLIWERKDDAYVKMRMGYGLSGNLGGIDEYNTMQLVAPNGVVNVGGRTATTLALTRNANPDLKWEVKRTFNVGVNAGLWNKRVVMSMEYYYSRVSDMLYLYDVPVPPFIYNKMMANLGKMRNSGFEIGLGVIPVRNKDWDLSVGMNMSFERNKLLSLNGEYRGYQLTAPSITAISGLSGAGFHGGSSVVYQIVGQPLGVFYLPHCLGLKTDDSGAKTYEVTKEKYICGQATPKMRLGMNIALRYRDWDLTMQANGAFGHHIYNGTALAYMNMQSLPNYNVMKGAPEMNIQDQTISDYWLERGDYLNIDYVTVGWNVPIKSRYLSTLRVLMSVNNLCTITSYSGLTPIINSTVMNSRLGVDDKYSLPVYRCYSVGVSVKF
ncbi:MAG: SusC/RagA family TonB-linked outer membrane protein [Prevotella sp.]|nr:SusC/RagA family TonB-linked outer membrane protein [Prevotella sp.]